MADCNTPYRLQVLKALCCHLEGIRMVDGYRHDLNGRVFRGRAVFGDEAPTTMLSILEAPRADPGIFAGEQQARREYWTLLVQGTCPSEDQENPIDSLYGLAADVELRLAMINSRHPDTGNPLFPDAFRLGRIRMSDGTDGDELITDLEIGPPVIRPPTETTSKPMFYLVLRVGLADVLG